MRTPAPALFLATALRLFAVPPIPLSEDATTLFEALALDWAPNTTNVLSNLPTVSGGTNEIAPGVVLWAIPSEDQGQDFLSFGMEIKGVGCRGNLTRFHDPETAMSDVLEGEFLNSLPREFIVDRTSAIPGIGDGCLARHAMDSSSGSFSGEPISLHFFWGNVSCNLFSEMSSTNLVEAARSIVSFLGSLCP